MKRLPQVIVTLICLTALSYQLAHADTSAQYYWNQAQASQGQERDANLLLTADALLKGNRPDEARDVIKSVKNPSATPHMTQFKRLVDARYNFVVGNLTQALSRIEQVSTQDLTPAVLEEYYLLKAQINEAAGRLMTAVSARVDLDAYLSSRDDFAANDASIWAALQHASPADLSNALQSAKGPLKGWIELASIERQLTSPDTSYAAQLQDWRDRYKGHPAIDFIPSNIAKSAVPQYRPTHIALLLPLQGKLAPSGTAVRDGFMAAYYGDAQLQNRPAYQISVLDTKDDTEVAQAYESARAAGANIIVGPLTKQGVEQLAGMAAKEITVLALNYTSARTPANVIEFGLSPEDEAKQAARKAFEDGHRSALVLVQDGEWGARVSDAFTRQWKKLGGDILDSRTYKSGDQLSGTVKKLLKVDDSENRAKKLANDVNMQVSADVRRRQDIDMVFLGAMPGDARQIQPLLAFYYAQDIPVYATASVYGGTPNPAADKDLNGMTFCDASWLIEERPSNPDPNNTLAKLFPSPQQPQLRLYALGVDAYEIIPMLNRLDTLPNFTFSGATGKLSLYQGNVVRGLRCTKFIDGQPKRLPSSF